MILEYHDIWRFYEARRNNSLECVSYEQIEHGFWPRKPVFLTDDQKRRYHIVCANRIIERYATRAKVKDHEIWARRLA